MAKKKQEAGQAPGVRRVTTVEERVEEHPSGGELDLTPADSPGEDDDALSALAELAGGSEARCEVRRTSPADFAGYCCSYALSEMSLDRLQAEWGGGKFSIRVRTARGEFKGSINVQIAGKPKHRDDAQAAPVAASPASPGLDVAALIAAATASTKGQVDMLSGLVTALINKETPKPEKGPDVLAIIGQLAPLLKPERAAETGGDAVKLLLQGIELGKEFAGGGDGGGDTFTNLALKGMDMVTKVAATQPARVVQRPPVPMAALPRALPAIPPGTVAASEPVNETSSETKTEVPPMLKLLGWLKQQTQLLVHQAQRKKNPGLYAELFLDNIPEGVPLETLYEKLAAESYLEDLAGVTGNAAVLQHRAWFDAFRQEVLNSLAGDDDEANAGAIDVANYEPGEGEIGGEGS